MTEGNRLAYFFAFLLAVLTNRGIRTVGLTNCTFLLFDIPRPVTATNGTTVQPKLKAKSRKRFIYYESRKQSKDSRRLLALSLLLKLH